MKTTTSDYSQTQVDRFAKEYSEYVKKSAVSVLELAKLIKRAKDDLSKAGFNQFCKQIGSEPSGSYIKKMICIADNEFRFNKVQDRLPPSYTTLYLLTQFSDEVFKKICDDGVLHAGVTANKLLPYKSEAEHKSLDIPNYVCSFAIPSNMESQKIQSCILGIEAILAGFNIELKKSKEFNERTCQAANDAKAISAAVDAAFALAA